MKATAFAYAKPASLAEAFELLQRPDAKVLAGGQSLIPSLNMRLSSPELLVDISGLAGSFGIIDVKGDVVRIGALVTHAAAARIPRTSRSTSRCWRRPCRTSRTRRSATAARSAAASRSPIRPLNIPPCAVALEAAFVICKAGMRNGAWRRSSSSRACSRPT